MTEWDNHPWSNFCDPNKELIWHKQHHPGTSEIFAPLEIAIGTKFHAYYCHKITPVLLPVNEKAFWPLLPRLISLLSGSTMQPENT